MWLARIAHKPWLLDACYILLALLILGPLLLPGYIVTLDMVFGPQIVLPDNSTPSWLFYGVLWLLHTVLPVDWLQKIILVLILWLAAAGMSRLVRATAPPSQPTLWLAAAAVAGLFYVFNPFVMTRFVAGQIAVLAGYALLPWALRAGYKLFKTPSKKYALQLALWLTAIAVMSIHTLPIALLALSVFGVLFLWRQRQALYVYTAVLLPAILLSLAVSLLFNAFWLLPLLLHKGAFAETLQTVNTFNATDFASASDPLFGLAATVLALYGFWADNLSLYVLPKDELDWWWLPLIGIWLLVVAGSLYMWRYSRGLALSIGIIAVVGFCWSLGLSNHILAPCMLWIAQHMPFAAGYREPQKWTMLIVLTFALCIAFAVANLLRLRASNLWRLTVFVLTTICIISYTPTFLWGVSGQLRSVQYPASWYAANNMLEADVQDFAVLALPWHHYMSYDFTGRTVAALPPHFFTKPVIVSNRAEWGSVQPLRHNVRVEAIDAVLQNEQKSQLSQHLAAHNVKYILLMKTADYKKYAFMYSQPALKLVFDSQELTLFKNNSWEPQ